MRLSGAVSQFPMAHCSARARVTRTDEAQQHRSPSQLPPLHWSEREGERLLLGNSLLQPFLESSLATGASCCTSKAAGSGKSRHRGWRSLEGAGTVLAPVEGHAVKEKHRGVVCCHVLPFPSWKDKSQIGVSSLCLMFVDLRMNQDGFYLAGKG